MRDVLPTVKNCDILNRYNAQDTEAVARLASAIERFTGVCVLVLEANIGSFELLWRAEQRLTLAFFVQKASIACILSSAAYFVLTSTSSP